MFTKQETFNIVAKHLLAQKERAMNIDGVCVYRNGKGQKCAAGCLIPDEVIPTFI